jgi:5-formyltetrahydrofolate cyclo-ligase
MLRRRRAVAPQESARAGDAVAARIIASAEFEGARRVVAHAATGDEVPTTGVVEAALSAKKVVLWPRVSSTGELEVAPATLAELVRGEWGTLAPPAHIRAESLQPGDLVLVPGLAFTRSGDRLGRGGGHYDRLLAIAGVTSIGIAFDIQLADEVPLEPHDRGVDLVVTPNGLWRRAR